ncbi:MAG TPA: PD-(D/E)XK nuclease-like domain-containing protein [Pseudoxanthomonas sp.]
MSAPVSAEAPSQPGYYLNIPNDAYHAGPGVSKSQLDLLHLAPALLQWSKDAPRDDEARAAVDLGDAFHALLLEPERFEAEYALDFTPPDGALVTTDHIKAYMDEHGIGYTSKDTKGTLVDKLLLADPDAPVLERLREAWASELGGRTVLTAAEFRKLQLMRASTLAHPFARALLEAEGDIEPCIYWTDPITGELCRCRPDKSGHIGSFRFLLDVKSTGDIDHFAASIEDYRYHVQDAFYGEGYEQHYGAPPDAFIFLAVSTTRNAGRYPVRCFMLDANDRMKGRADFRADLDRYATCKRDGVWPGIETITRPEWARRRDAA